MRFINLGINPGGLHGVEMNRFEFVDERTKEIFWQKGKETT
jgi:hypothetical protein